MSENIKTENQIANEEYTDDDLLDAARLLAEHCLHYPECGGCVFHLSDCVDKSCVISDEPPCNWNV